MAEYIKREDVLSNKVFMKGGAAASPYVQGYLDGLDAVEEAITTPPAADVVEVRHGRWIAMDKYMVDQCSNCQFEMDWDAIPLWLVDMPHFKGTCPNCGAKMEGGVDGES